MQISRISFAAMLVACAACSGATDDAAEALTAETPGNAKSINIGFDGDANQFAYEFDFWNASRVHPGVHLCHWYLPWNVTSESATDPKSSLSYFKNAWLPAARGRCNEVLISFKAASENETLPAKETYASAFSAFVGTPWAAQTGFNGKFVFTAWNEPNNGSPSGNGLALKKNSNGQDDMALNAIPAHIAAEYFLEATKVCRTAGCKVAAGDFASNGNLWLDMSWNCADDAVAENQLCSKKSSVNKSNDGASYMDRYKNFIANHRNDPAFLLGAAFHPSQWAYHGWHDVNEWIKKGVLCETYANCATRRFLANLGGMWAKTEVWDTEVGVSQGDAIDDQKQACGAAFLMKLSASSDRITRLYYTRLHNPDTDLGGALVHGNHVARPALGVLANRETQCTTPPPAPPTLELAFQGASSQMMLVSPAGLADSGLGMMPGTSPSVAVAQTGGFEAAFQANTGNLWTQGGGDQHFGMNAQSSPAIAALTSGGYQIAFEANTNNLWTVGAVETGDTNLGMMSGTSPAIAPLAQGGFIIAFQANTTHLYTYQSNGVVKDWQLGMMPGTSPSITGLANGGYQIAFQSNVGELWSVGSEGTFNLQFGMKAGTSPAITALLDGGTQIAFQANTGSLWSVGAEGNGDTGLGMMNGTSPGISGLPGGGYEMAFQANTGELWLAGDPGEDGTGLPMAAGSSPSGQ